MALLHFYYPLAVNFTPHILLRSAAASLILGIVAVHGQETPPPAEAIAPPPAESFDKKEEGAGDLAKPSNFRYTYPVRDGGSNQIYTEKKPAAEVPIPRNHNFSSEADSDTAEPVSFETVGGETVPSSIDVGEGIFSKRPYRFSFAVYEGYNSNVNTQQDNGVESLYTQISAGFAYDFGTSRLQLTTSLSAGLTYYYNQSGLDNDGLFPTVIFVLGAEYAATSKMDLSFSTSTSLLSAGNYSTPGAPNSFQGSYILSDSKFGLRYHWLPKFSTETIYNPRIYYFADQDYNDTQGRVEQTISQQFQFLWKPTTTLVAEYRFDTRNYYQENYLNSIGNYALLGFDHILNPRTTLSVRGGAEQRFNQNPVRGRFGGGSTEDTYIGPFAQLNASYAAGKNTTVGLQARYGTTASGLVNYNQGQQLLIGLTASHRFTRRLTANMFFNYQNNVYQQPDSSVYGIEVSPNFTTDVYNAGLNASFALTRNWSLLAGYTFTTSLSTDTVQMRDYTQNIAYIGTQVDF